MKTRLSKATVAAICPYAIKPTSYLVVLHYHRGIRTVGAILMFISVVCVHVEVCEN